ncbi:MAG: nuclear transport factor 2 family protein, partial [Caulobacterales bacterium]
MKNSAAEEEIVRTILERHAEAFRKNDVKTIMADYAEHAVMMTRETGAVRGHDAIRQLYTMIFSDIFPAKSTELTFEPVLIAGGVGLLHWSASTPALIAENGFDSF